MQNKSAEKIQFCVVRLFVSVAHRATEGGKGPGTNGKIPESDVNAWYWSEAKSSAKCIISSEKLIEQN